MSDHAEARRARVGVGPLLLLLTLALLAAVLPGVAVAAEGSVSVGLAVQDGRLVGAGTRFVEGPPLAFAAGLDRPVDALEVTARVYDSDDGGSERIAVSDTILVDPAWTLVTGSSGALPPGDYVIRLFRGTERIASGSFTVVPLPTPVPTPRPTPAPVEGRSWLLVAMSDGAVMNPVPDVAGITLLLLDGIASGHAGCNDYRGPYTIAGHEIVFGEMATTLRACEDDQVLLESNYLQGLSFVARFGLGDVGLLFASPPGAPLLAWIEAPEGDLTGTWTLATLGDPDGAPVPADPSAEVTITFHDDGVARGNDGCNSYGGTWTTSGPRIAIRELSATRAACPSQALSDQEERFLVTLMGATTWSASPQELTLRGADGRVGMTLTRAGAITP